MKSLTTISILILLSCNIFGQMSNFSSHSNQKIDCKLCHICDTPTKADPCLIICPRNEIEVIRHLPEEGPERIIIDEIKTEHDIYSPVYFSHRSHSEMSLMSGGCSSCHHFNPAGKIVKCSTCHEANRQRTDLSKPDLKAAFHRQCMDCHSRWEENLLCKDCHSLNSETGNTILTELKPVKSHTEIKVPAKLVYETESEEGSLVTFFHNEHVSLFRLECTDCHSNESCINCHNQKANFEKPELEESHENCSSCHDTEDDCSSCHSESELKPFNHLQAAGFSLNKFHNKLSCVSCHKSEKSFAGLNQNCSSCHNFENGDFDHSITGIVLDKNHEDNECIDCHTQKNYNKVDCESCHDDEISYPESLPGTKK